MVFIFDINALVVTFLLGAVPESQFEVLFWQRKIQLNFELYMRKKNLVRIRALLKYIFAFTHYKHLVCNVDS